MRQWCPGDSVAVDKSGVYKTMLFREMVVLRENMIFKRHWGPKDSGAQ